MNENAPAKLRSDLEQARANLRHYEMHGTLDQWVSAQDRYFECLERYNQACGLPTETELRSAEEAPFDPLRVYHFQSKGGTP
jgi:hypothetical protein